MPASRPLAPELLAATDNRCAILLADLRRAATGEGGVIAYRDDAIADHHRRDHGKGRSQMTARNIDETISATRDLFLMACALLAFVEPGHRRAGMAR